MTTFNDVLAYVTNEATENESRALFDAANARIKALRTATAAENIANLQPGATVRLTNLRPKYLAGLVGEVVGVEGNRVRVKLDEATARGARRYVSPLDNTILAPAAAVTLV